MSIQAVSFGKQAYTDNGAKYDKTNVGGKSGLAAGAAFSVYKIAQGTKAIKKVMPEMQTQLLDVFKEAGGAETLKMTAEEYIAKATKATKIAKNVTFGILTAITIGIGYGLGKIVDKVINNKRANAADKPAEIKEQK